MTTSIVENSPPSGYVDGEKKYLSHYFVTILTETL